MPIIGVLAIQGDFVKHEEMLNKIGVESRQIRLPEQLDDVDGLIIPGGESTTIVQLIDTYGFRNKIKNHVENGMSIWGTCAGMIVLARKLLDKRPSPLGLLDIEVTRNAFGRQLDSFETNLFINGIDGPPLHAIFIRAPIVTEVGNNVEILATVDEDLPVAVRENKILATSFHPELTKDVRMHEMFTEMSTL